MTAVLNPELVLSLHVEDACRVAQDIHRIVLCHPDGSQLPDFTPGAHILIQAPNGMTRRYSLCNAPHEGEHYEIAVKRDASGRGGSISVADGVKVGGTMYVSLPRNDF